MTADGISTKQVRWQIRFSLRGMLLATMLIAGLFAWVNYEVGAAREQRLAVEAILAGGGGIAFADGSGTAPRGVARLGDPLPANWLTRLLGENPQLQIKDAVVGNLQQTRRGLRHYEANGDENLRFIPQLRGLENLDARGATVTNAGLRHLERAKTLRTLSLNESAITDAGLQSLVGLSRLEILVLQNAPICDKGLASVSQLSELRTLSLAGTNVSDAGLLQLQSLTRLRRLILDGTNIGHAPPLGWSLGQLERLSVASTQVGDDWIPIIAGMPMLSELDLSGTQITDSGLQQLAEIANLEVLLLGNCPHITPAGRAKFRELRPDVQEQ